MEIFFYCSFQAIYVLTAGSCKVRCTTSAALDELGSFAYEVSSMPSAVVDEVLAEHHGE